MSVYPMNVRYSHPNAGYEYDQRKAREHLTVGQVYKLREAHVDAWRTDYVLAECPGERFNSVLFDPA